MIVVIAFLKVHIVWTDHLDFSVVDFMNGLVLLWVGEIGLDAQVDLQILLALFGLFDVDGAQVG